MNTQKKPLINWFGLLGIISFLSYTAAVIFAPSAYPGYDWKSQAISDLSAANAPSEQLWSQLACLHDIGGVICIAMVCVAVQGKLNKTTRAGIYIFATMTFITSIGYTLFPLSDSGYAGTFQDMMHVYVVTYFGAVLLSIVSLVLVMVGGYRKKSFIPLALCATIALSLMLVGAIGHGVVPKEYFGILERFSPFAVVGFTAALGIFLFAGKFQDRKNN